MPTSARGRKRRRRPHLEGSRAGRLECELDAAYFHLYGIERDDVEYILSTFTNTGLVAAEKRTTEHFLWQPGSTGRLILEEFDRMTVE